MLPKSKRLTAEGFKQFRNARASHTAHFLLRFRGVPAGAEKFAVVVPSSAYKKAILRNLLRRRMYHLMRAHQEDLRGLSIAAVVKKGTLALTFKELEREFLDGAAFIRRGQR
ncbi:MAG: ribonuclease P protein component [Candidatus Taylorbacteria bacterium RIFCSPHIGHO2_02_49_25]|uniref:Ribonuclease P protein component n=1 Tax=Candidatus Taylorbacteria bacterium RIFCSPHIGHO2_02_49_25 TaxID=1802305 RepID=A0A1G2MGL2_9BACT|nr:MAG: hypothetical protein UY62_C0009G0028 [Parcubacteria group bacterium GW2011_GWF2_50_9]OHA20703.1 MAG: ribonuclease P protein component [Candidatus Taylorbacteria bacterium RIFCSPHIGHO2_01_FULL_49_60]OHA23055.1 MAG: ribonuclease P protein component [Candidatus Taylorbacteria bacterium RIFCSPHIGHO2_02_49_25]OHA35308.1 MAG: ribonuclease P protein component [Candidatus Taylorbacteria bacterium RIFCSPLOWO2_01_FULL_50_130]OHA36392.1 MAG: ribonuclease P protein component [Candidatus Taylorbacte